MTGASGFIGRGLAAALLKAGAEVHGVSRRPPGDLPGVRWHALDLSQPGALRPLEGESWSHLFHLANADIRNLDRPLGDYLALDVAATRELAALAKACGARLVYAGSGSVYRPSDRPHREEDALEPLSRYAESKIAAERALAAGVSCDWTVARLFGVYGPGEGGWRLVPTLCRALLRRETARLSAGTQVRDMLHLDDAVGAIALLGASPLPGGSRIFNVGSGEGRSVREIAAILAGLLGGGEGIVFGEPSQRLHDCSRWVSDIGRIREATGWRPTLSWEEGLARAAEGWRRAP